MYIISYLLKQIIKYIDDISTSWFEFDQDMQMYHPNYLYFYGISNYDINFTNPDMNLFLNKNNEIKQNKIDKNYK